MRDYFEAEMRLLHEAAREFGKQHPEQARMLNLDEMRDRDPYVERLLEGVAFLTAHVRSRIDESASAVSEQLLQQYCPEQLEPAPSMTILSFDGGRDQTGFLQLPAEADVGSQPVGAARARCHFTTIAPVSILPLSLVHVSTTRRPEGGSYIDLQFNYHGEVALRDGPIQSIGLYLHADPGLASSLYYVLVAGFQALQVRPDGAAAAQWQPVPSGRTVGMFLDDVRMPAGRARPRSLPFNLVRDYFHFRERFHAVQLLGLDAIQWPTDCASFTLRVVSRDGLPEEHRLSTQHLRMHCVPAVNLFAMDAEPVLVDQRRTEYRLIADQSAPDDVVPHSVEAVEGRDMQGTAQRPYPAVWNVATAAGGGGRHFRIALRDHGADFPVPYLTLGGDPSDRPEVLSCRVMASNGHLPRRVLHVGDINQPGDGIPGGIGVRNLIRPSPCRRPPDNFSYRQRLHAVMALGVTSLADRLVLQRVLSTLDWSGTEENRQRIAAIIRVAVRPAHEIRRGIHHRGLRVTVVLDERGFSGDGDLYLFGSVLHRLFAGFTPIAMFLETCVSTRPSGKEYRWTPLEGTAPAL